MKAFELGKPIDGFLVGRVTHSKNPSYEVGKMVYGWLPWSEYNYIPVNSIPEVYRPIVLENKYNIPWSAYTGVLGLAGSTAYMFVLQEGKMLTSVA